MKIIDPIERAQEAATQALADMGRHGVAPTPDNYLIWYSHRTGRHPDLSRALREIEAAGLAFSEARLSELHEQFMGGNGQTSLVFESNCERIGDLMSRILGQVGGFRRDTGRYSEELKHFDASLEEGGDADTMRALVAGVLGATWAIQGGVRQLEENFDTTSHEIAALKASLVDAQREANTDGLTGIPNRRRFDFQLHRAMREARTDEQPLSLLLLDIDHFKAFNDAFGHQVGDRVLKLVAEIITACVKGRDLPARYGGEEFAVILPDTAIKGAESVAEQIRAMVAGQRVRLKSSGRSLGQITISVGCGEYLPGEPVTSLIERADQALYRAKHAGRNRVVAAGPDEVRGIAAA